MVPLLTPAAAGPLFGIPSLQTQLAYQERAILNAGFSSGPVTMDLVENGRQTRNCPRPTPRQSSLMSGLSVSRRGTCNGLLSRNPAGSVIAENRAAPLESNKAQVLLFTGKKRPASGWEQGTYKATYVVERDGQVVLKKDMEFTL